MTVDRKIILSQYLKYFSDKDSSTLSEFLKRNKNKTICQQWVKKIA